MILRGAVPEGWFEAVEVGPELRLLHYREPDAALDEPGTYRFEHPCKPVAPDENLVAAPVLDPDEFEISGSGDEVSVVPSILCPDCGTHGVVTDGRWTAA
jgi:hypothetical protein